MSAVVPKDSLLTIKPRRPMLRYHGGKWRLAPWIVSKFPAHRIYVEAYGGAGSVLIRKERSYSEIYNELDGEIVNLFRVVRDQGAALRELLRLTPYAREEYRLSFLRCEDVLEQARRTVIRSYMGFGSNSLCRTVKSGFRSNSSRAYNTPAGNWKNYPDALESLIARLQGVVIENRKGIDVMVQHDSPETLHYCDPTYLHETRTTWAGHGAHSGYAHEMTDKEHCELAECLFALKGSVILSGYPSRLYEKLFSDWRCERKRTRADGARPRTECLWMNFTR